MNFTHENSWNAFETILRQGLSLPDSWNQFIDFLEKIKSKAYWQELRKINYDQEKVAVTGWLNNLAAKSPIPDSVKSLWIGIAQLYDEKDDKEFYAYYLQGADDYDEQDIEWATTPSYEPVERYFVPATLNGIIYTIRDDKTDFSFLDWILPLAYSSFLFDNIIRTGLDKSKFIASQNQIHVSIGYNGGDFINLTSLKSK